MILINGDYTFIDIYNTFKFRVRFREKELATEDLFKKDLITLMDLGILEISKVQMVKLGKDMDSLSKNIYLRSMLILEEDMHMT